MAQRRFRLFAMAALLVSPVGRAENLAAFPKDADKLPAVRYAPFSPAECKAELTTRNVAFEETAEPAPGALIPVRLSAADAHIFNAVLTPNYNRAHKNHVHLEVKAGVTWFLVR